MIAAAIKKDWSYRNNCGIRLHVGDLEHKKIDLPVFFFFFFVFLCFAIPDLDLGILKMLNRVRFCDVLQPEVY